MSSKEILPYYPEYYKASQEFNHGRPYQQCTMSLMDTIADPNIIFDVNGVCQYYQSYLKQEKEQVLTGKDGEEHIAALVAKIKASGEGKPYDCITGVSGGVDSTYLTYMAKQWGLRPLVVHFDNGWNSEMAVKNIENIISLLGFDLHTLVVDWEEFRDIQRAFFAANVVDIEAITDHAIIATLHKLAHKHGLKYILSGANVVTEAILPSNWIWNKTDHVNISAIHKKFGKKRLKTYPLFNRSLKKKSQLMGVTAVNPLNAMPYNKAEVKQLIQEKLGWRDYGGKHYESVFTRFYQGYILPVKFGIDKRKAHLSNLIFSGQITKDEALKELEQPIFGDNNLKLDYEFVMKKLLFSHEEFETYLKAPRKEHRDYPIETSIWEQYAVLKPFKGIRAAIGK